MAITLPIKRLCTEWMAISKLLQRLLPQLVQVCVSAGRAGVKGNKLIGVLISTHLLGLVPLQLLIDAEHVPKEKANLEKRVPKAKANLEKHVPNTLVNLEHVPKANANLVLEVRRVPNSVL